MKAVLSDRSVERKRLPGDVVCECDEAQAAIGAKASAQPAGVSSSIRVAGWGRRRGVSTISGKLSGASFWAHA